jgi:Tol biopolymer transport system component
MKRLFPILIATAVVAAVAGVRAQQSAPQLEKGFASAEHAATVDGDLKGAIEQYKTIVSRAGTDRETAARALLRMAECYQKLGDAQARAIYQELVGKYADQREVATIARERLGGAAPIRGRSATQRAVWTGPYVDLFGQVSPDGRYITFVDWVRSLNLMVHDVTTDTDRALTNLEPIGPSGKWHGEAEWSTISKDGKQVAYAWIGKAGPPYELRVMPLHGNAATDSRRILITTPETQFLGAMDWSADGQWIAAGLQRTDGTGQIALIGVADGSLSVLKTTGWRGPERIFFSPDSKFIAYDLPANDTTDQRDIFVMPIDHSREIHAVDHQADDRLAGWSPDGSRLLFTSNRTGSGLWAQPFSATGPQGVPELLASDISGLSLGLTASGALYIYKGLSDRDVRTAPIDLAAGKVLSPPASFDRGVLSGVTIPSWSPDGQYLAYQIGEGEPSQAAIAIRTVATGDVRRIPGLYARDPRWSPDGHSLITAARDRRGRNGIFRVDVATGEITPVLIGPGSGVLPQWSADGTRIYYKQGPGAIVERDLKSGTERAIFTTASQIGIYELSPDGRHLAVRMRADGPTGSTPSRAGANVMIVPLDGGEPREVVPPAPGGLRTIAWTPDSSSLLVLKRPASAPAQLWLTPLNGGEPRKLEIAADGWIQGSEGALDSGFSLSPDGKRIAVLTGKRSAEVWALENFLPPVTKPKTSARVKK